jgi:hypothetical protein
MAPRMDLDRDEISGPCQAGWTGRGNSSLCSPAAQLHELETAPYERPCLEARFFSPLWFSSDRFAAAIEQTVNKGV